MDDFRFQGQHEEEKIAFILKRHWWYLLFPSFKSAIIRLVLIITLLFTITGWFNINMSNSRLFFFIIIIDLATLIYLILSDWYKWGNTIYVLTNERIICVQQLSWFSRSVSESTLENIMFISHKIQGMIGTIFNFGSVNIRTSGVTEEETVFQQVSDPYQVQQQITKMQKDTKNFDRHSMYIDTRQVNKKSSQNKEDQDFWSQDDKSQPRKKI